MDREMLGRFIAQRRKERNMTQRELAEKLHVTDTVSYTHLTLPTIA